MVQGTSDWRYLCRAVERGKRPRQYDCVFPRLKTARSTRLCTPHRHDFLARQLPAECRCAVYTWDMDHRTTSSHQHLRDTPYKVSVLPCITLWRGPIQCNGRLAHLVSSGREKSLDSLKNAHELALSCLPCSCIPWARDVDIRSILQSVVRSICLCAPLFSSLENIAKTLSPPHRASALLIASHALLSHCLIVPQDPQEPQDQDLKTLCAKMASLL